MGKTEITLENTAAEYLDRVAKTEENVGWIMETIDVIGKTTELNTEYIHELHEMAQENRKKLNVIEQETKRDFMLVGIVDCLLLALIGVTALIF